MIFTRGGLELMLSFKFYTYLISMQSSRYTRALFQQAPGCIRRIRPQPALL